MREVSPAKIVVVDGILVLWERSLRERFDLKVWLRNAADWFEELHQARS